ncbi:MAG: hypothetical protein JW775_07405 [Candidatus Aminicenantes bacterium]|nr:hypothetical protein [Candidatus Aminicenantes bacterium]
MGPVFHFYTRLNLPLLLGRKARTIPELLAGLESAPGASVYYHTHRFLQQHHYLSPEPPNDFAFWVTASLGLDALGERLASVDTVKFRTIMSLRDKFVEILKTYTKETGSPSPQSPPGEEFHFLSCRTFILPTRHKARTLPEFLEVIRGVSINSIYFHMFEARLRLERGENDFSNWFEGIEKRDLAAEVARLDPYTMTLEGLRKVLIQKVGRHVQN